MTILAKIRKTLRGILRPADEAVEYIPDYDLPLESYLNPKYSFIVDPEIKAKFEKHKRQASEIEKIQKIDGERILEVVDILLERKKMNPNLIRKVGILSGNPVSRYSSDNSYERAGYVQDFYEKMQEYYASLGYFNNYYQMQMDEYVEIMKRERPRAYKSYEKTMRAKNPPTSWEESLAPIREEERKKRYEDITLLKEDAATREANYKKFKEMIDRISGDKNDEEE